MAILHQSRAIRQPFEPFFATLQSIFWQINSPRLVFCRSAVGPLATVYMPRREGGPTMASARQGTGTDTRPPHHQFFAHRPSIFWLRLCKWDTLTASSGPCCHQKLGVCQLLRRLWWRPTCPAAAAAAPSLPPSLQLIHVRGHWAATSSVTNLLNVVFKYKIFKVHLTSTHFKYNTI